MRARHLLAWLKKYKKKVSIFCLHLKKVSVTGQRVAVLNVSDGAAAFMCAWHVVKRPHRSRLSKCLGSALVRRHNHLHFIFHGTRRRSDVRRAFAGRPVVVARRAPVHALLHGFAPPFAGTAPAAVGVNAAARRSWHRWHVRAGAVPLPRINASAQRGAPNLALGAPARAPALAGNARPPFGTPLLLRGAARATQRHAALQSVAPVKSGRTGTRHAVRSRRARRRWAGRG